jgi:prevent-host-death family protein
VKKASITEAKNNLSALLDSVRGGDPVLIVDRGRPVARLEPLRGATGEEGLLARLIREGVVRPARGAAARSVLATKPSRPRKPASALRALLDERREGR